VASEVELGSSSSRPTPRLSSRSLSLALPEQAALAAARAAAVAASRAADTARAGHTRARRCAAGATLHRLKSREVPTSSM